MTAHPHNKNIKKMDPVSKWQAYKEGWKAQRAPGEKAHKGLRWNIREQMLYHDTVVEKVCINSVLYPRPVASQV